MKILPLGLLVLATGCSGSLFGPEPDASIAIEVESLSLSETTLLVGERVPLGVTFTRKGGDREVAWRSEDVTIATVTPAGEATGVSQGSTRIIAEAGTLADTILISVLAGAPGEGHCSATGSIRLNRGQAYTTTASSAPRLCIQGGTGVEQYILVPFNATSAGPDLLVEVSTGPAAASLLLAPPSAAAVSTQPSGLVLGQGPMRSVAADRRLREMEARELEPLVTADGPARGGARALAAAVIPTAGQTLPLNVNSSKPCGDATTRQMRVAAVSRKAIILHDVANPAGGFTDAEYASFAATFDDLIQPTVVQNFGEPTDIDGNSRVMIVYTRAVNEMTERGADAYIAGFFFSRDLFPRKDSGGLRGCGGSNAGEILYLMVPDPTGEVNGNVRTRDFVTDRTLGVMAHEFQHLVGASRRLRVLGLENWNEEFWLNEGMSHIAEELTFYAATGRTPRQEIQLSNLGLGSITLQRFNQFQSTNFARLAGFMKNPSATSPISGEALETRGASWAFLRYAADRRGGSETEMWRRLIDSDLLGYENLAAALGTSPLGWVHDWAVSLYTDDFISPVAPQFRQPSWNFRSIVPAFATGGTGTYPLKVTDLLPSSPRATAEIGPGAASIIRFSLGPAARVELKTTSGGVAPPRDLRLTLMRVR